MAPRLRSWLAPIALTAALAVSSLLAPPLGQATPDLRLLDTLRLLWAPKPKAIGNIQLPRLLSTRAQLPNVLMIVTEGVRADSYCSAPQKDCPFNPELSRLFPDRVGLTRLHSLASFTVLSMSALTTGRIQAVSRSELLQMPSLFDYVKALSDKSVYTAYWSAHNHPMFERDDIRVAIDSYITAEDLVGDQDWHEDADDRLLALFQQKLPSLPRPFFLVLHVINTHTPYAFDPSDTPFVPFARDFSWTGMPLLFNTYRNAIRRQDRILRKGLEAWVQSPDFAQSIVVFTSDHGEEFGEHKQIHHGQDLFEEQTHVPAWIAFGPAALSADQAQTLRAQSDRPTTHLDILPTLLDAYGVLESYGFERYRNRFEGRSLLRPLPGAPAPVPMTSCTEAFPCPFRNWGMLWENYKVEAQEWDPGWNCWDTSTGREVPVGLDQPVCQRLQAESRKYFPTLPNGKSNNGVDR